MMSNHNIESKSSKNRWSFLTRTENNNATNKKRNKGPSQRGFIPPDFSRNVSQLSQSSFNAVSSVLSRSNSINSSVATIGLNAPTSFQFSPSLKSGQSAVLKQRFLSFVSNQQIASESNGVASGVSVRNMGENAHPGEKSVFVLNLEPIWNDIENDDELESLGAEPNSENQRGSNLLDPNVVMDDYVTPLLNTSLPVYRLPAGCDETNFLSPSGIHNTNNLNVTISISGLSNESLSLEEKLRRERQRVHSNGITEFDWGINKFIKSYLKPSTSNIYKYSNVPLELQNKITENNDLRIIVPLRGNIYVQDGVGDKAKSPLRLLYDKSMLDDCHLSKEKKGKNVISKNRSIRSSIGQDAVAIDPQLSPDGSMVAFVIRGELFVMRCDVDSDDCGQELHVKYCDKDTYYKKKASFKQ
jgi:hypothetical protein